jgi:hypothetical protein
VQRQAAGRALSGGFAGSQAARNLTARDLGRTSLALQQAGNQQFSNILGTTPFAPVANYEFTPQDITRLRECVSWRGFDAECWWCCWTRTRFAWLWIDEPWLRAVGRRDSRRWCCWWNRTPDRLRPRGATLNDYGKPILRTRKHRAVVPRRRAAGESAPGA